LYPVTYDDTKPSAFGKYAWKPSSEATSTLTGVKYSMARDGKITLVLEYDPVQINGKMYKQAKTVPSRMVEMSGIGVGSTVTVKLCGDISPQIIEFQSNEAATPYVLPAKCPFCGAPTQTNKGGKSSPITLKCVASTCVGINIQKYINLFKVLQIKGIAEGRLNGLISKGKLNINPPFEVVNAALLKTGTSLTTVLNKTDIRTFLLALGCGGKTKIDKILPPTINPLGPILPNIAIIGSLVEPLNDLFMIEFIKFIAKMDG
jgi:hypothetical protein